MDASVNRIPSSADERTYLVAIKRGDSAIDDIDDSLDELSSLVTTAGAIVVGSETIKRERLDPAHIIGRGAIERLKARISENRIKLLVFDLNSLKPAQIRNLESILQCRVIGRTEVIMDIFARRARSSESKIQVELAQLKYILPRLKGLGGVLSRLGGGIGTRGPGEKMLETDRRHILRRIAKLNDKLEKITEHRRLTRKSRSEEVRGSVVGYTNTGKSTLINLLARDDLFVEDRLFATLDSYTRSVYISENHTVLLSDTVGFITNLPANLLESFKSTLEEIQYSHFLIHIVDLTSRNIRRDIETVNRELSALDVAGKKTILFFNKTDACTDLLLISSMLEQHPGSLAGSAKTGEGMHELRLKIADLMDGMCVE